MLEDKGWDYYEVNLTDYPEKRADMLKLADRLTVPQLFFNNKHLGGASDLAALNDQGVLETLYAEMQNSGEEGPGDPLFDRPDYPPKLEDPVPERTEELICIGDQCLNYTEVNDQLLAHLEIKDRKYRLFRYRKCFVATEFVDMLLARFKSVKSRSEAVQIGRSMQATGLFDHVTQDHFFEDKFLFFTLQVHREPSVLNSYRIWNDRVAGSPMATLNVCKAAVSNIVEKYRDSAGVVDYEAVRGDKTFAAFEEMVCELQMIRLPAMEAHTRTAFCINTYNMMIIHAFIRVGPPQTNYQRSQFYDRVKYNIGGHDFSFNDIENGVLRANRVAPYHLSLPFSRDDPRRACANPNPEPRIHFALNCGAKSCPPVKSFTAEAVQEELRIVALSFMEQEQNCKIDLREKTLWLSKILSWYKVDFGNSNRDVAEKVVEWLRGEKKQQLELLLAEGKPINIRHFDYDWSNDSKPKTKPPSEYGDYLPAMFR